MALGDGLGTSIFSRDTALRDGAGTSIFSSRDTALRCHEKKESANATGNRGAVYSIAVRRRPFARFGLAIRGRRRRGGDIDTVTCLDAGLSGTDDSASCADPKEAFQKSWPGQDF